MYSKKEADKLYENYKKAYNDYLKILVKKELDTAYTIIPHPFLLLGRIITKTIFIAIILAGILAIISLIINLLYSSKVIQVNIVIFSINLTEIIKNLDISNLILVISGAFFGALISYYVSTFFEVEHPEYKPVKRSEIKATKNKFLAEKNIMQEFKKKNGITNITLYSLADEKSMEFKDEVIEEFCKEKSRRGWTDDKSTTSSDSRSSSGSWWAEFKNGFYGEDSDKIACGSCGRTVYKSDAKKVCCNCGAENSATVSASGMYYWYGCGNCGENRGFIYYCPRCGGEL